jgi:hypothetical protein
MVTVAELAAYLGVTPSAVRHVVRRHGIQPVGARWKAKLYDVQEVLRHTGHHDRLANSDPMCHTHR